MKKLEVLESNAKAAFENGDESQKKLLSDLWPEVFITDPYVLACLKLGKTPKPPLADRSDSDEVSADAYLRLVICIRAKNLIEGKIWKPVYDGSETSYWPYFKQNSAGFGFSRSSYGRWDANTGVGSRLEYRKEEFAKEGAIEFQHLYNDFFKL